MFNKLVLIIHLGDPWQCVTHFVFMPSSWVLVIHYSPLEDSTTAPLLPLGTKNKGLRKPIVYLFYEVFRTSYPLLFPFLNFV